MTYCIILVTCSDEKEADFLSKKLIDQRLAACVQTNPITSLYTWDNRICKDKEIRLTIKTRTKLFPDVEQVILEHHSYEVPQIVQIPIENGFQPYLDWISDCTSSDLK